MTLEPDGEATGCNPVEVGSTPTGGSFCPWGVPDQHATLRRLKIRFDSWQGYSPLAGWHFFDASTRAAISFPRAPAIQPHARDPQHEQRGQLVQQPLPAIG